MNVLEHMIVLGRVTNCSEVTHECSEAISDCSEATHACCGAITNCSEVTHDCSGARN